MDSSSQGEFCRGDDTTRRLIGGGEPLAAASSVEIACCCCCFYPRPHSEGCTRDGMCALLASLLRERLSLSHHSLRITRNHPRICSLRTEHWLYHVPHTYIYCATGDSILSARSHSFAGRHSAEVPHLLAPPHGRSYLCIIYGRSL